MDEKGIFEKLMKKELEPGPLRDQLKALRVKATYEHAMLFQMVRKAAEGDLSAAKYILGVVQEEEPEPLGPDFSELSTRELRRLAEEVE